MNLQICEATTTSTVARSQVWWWLLGNNDEVLLFDHWNQLSSEILAVKPSLKQDRRAVVHVVPERTAQANVEVKI